MTECDNSLWIFPNLELGDAIVCNGVCRWYAGKYPAIKWAARSSYVTEVAAMFADLRNVTVVDVGHYEEAKKLLVERSVRMGYFSISSEGFDEWKWDAEFYRQAALPFDERWKSFGLPPHMLPERRGSGAVLVHEVPERGIVIRPELRPKWFIPLTRMPRFWDWLPDILSAAELHFVDSAYLNLAESLYGIGLLRNTKLVFHRYAKKAVFPHGEPPHLRAPWTIL